MEEYGLVNVFPRLPLLLEILSKGFSYEEGKLPSEVVKVLNGKLTGPFNLQP